MNQFDFLIVGGGSAGAVLAARLSEDPATRVLLVEAGRDTPPNAIPADIADTFPSSSLNPDYFWPKLEAVRSTGSPSRPYLQARVMGGGSSVMGLWALRGLPGDYDDWLAAGAAGWGWNDVLPYFRRLENDADRDQSQTTAKPYPIQRLPREEWPAIVKTIEQAAAARGVREVQDVNEEPGDGFFAIPLSQDANSRASSASAYLTDAVRRRGNLAIMSEAHVTSLRFDGLRIIGATARHAGTIKQLSARETILCAGAIYSPTILMRSGIGLASDLRRLGITPILNRPGVGRNLQNHPYLHIALTLPPRSRLAGHLRRFGIAAMRLSSGASGCPGSDVLVFMIGRVSPRSYGPDIAMMGAALYAPFSRGRVTLTSADPDVPPCVEFRLLDDVRDPPRLLYAARYAESLLLEPTVAAAYKDAFLLPPVLSLHQFNRPGFRGNLLAIAAKTVLNAPAPMTRMIMNRLIQPGRWFANRFTQLPLTDAEILAAVAPMVHPSGTCAMGRPDNPMAVLDHNCRVHGISNLRVVDASVMPRIPSANTNLPTIMVSERAADLILSTPEKVARVEC